MMEWSIVYEKAVRGDGSLLFPERLTHEFLAQARRVMGSYLYANQYMNEIIPADEQTFKKEWLRYYAHLPDQVMTFAFIDPAIGEKKHHDYTACVVVSVDIERNWYVREATRSRMNPSEIIELCFFLKERWKPSCIGIEDVAFQRSIIHFAMEESRKRKIPLPITGVKRGADRTKQMRILSLVPRFEWGSLFLGKQFHDLELELGQFPRGAHDDLLDALASIEDIVHYPGPVRRKDEAPSPSHPGYEKWFIRNLYRRQGAEEEDLRSP